MSRLVIEGGTALSGAVGVSGSKNAALPILAATILTDGECRIENCPRITDVSNMLSILKHIGAKTEILGDTVSVCCAGLKSCVMPQRFSREIRSSIFMLGPVVSRFKKAVFCYPGGCEIGLRPIDLHLRGLRELNIDVSEERGHINCETNGITGADITLDYPSVGATENIMMAAVLAQGTTVIRNAAREPEICELAAFLNSMGAEVRGAGNPTIVVTGVESLHGASCRIKSDRIVTGTYMIAAAMCGGDVLIENTDTGMLHSLSGKLRASGVHIQQESGGVRVRGPERLAELNLIETSPYPGFPTDLQAQMCAAACVARGSSVILENVFENRFGHTSELIRMGASITVRNNVAIIRGVDTLYGAEVTACDLRAGAALVLAGLAAKGRTVVENAGIIDRGYESIEGAFTKLGARITRLED